MNIALCDLCETPFYFLGEDELCKDCRVLLHEDCTEVSADGNIQTCGNNKVVQVGNKTCVEESKNC